MNLRLRIFKGAGYRQLIRHFELYNHHEDYRQGGQTYMGRQDEKRQSKQRTLTLPPLTRCKMFCSFNTIFIKIELENTFLLFFD